MESDLVRRFSEHLARTRLFPEPGLALLAVSGGVDSVALLGLMSRVARAWSLDLAVAHVDHGILPESADVAENVLGLSYCLGLRGHLASLKLGQGTGETAARRSRYDALRALQSETGARYLVTAHHADDQVETVLFRVFRGSGPAGLAGIPPAGDRGLVRPLLPFRKEELEAWVAARFGPGGQERIHRDVTNEAPAVDRSWIRHHLLPALRDRLGGDVDRRILTVAGQAAADRRAWSAVLRALPELGFHSENGVVEVARTPMQTYDKELCEALLRALAREVGCVVGPARATRLRAALMRSQSGRIVELGQHWVAEFAFDRLRLFRRRSETSPDGACVEWGAESAGTLRWGRWAIMWCRQPARQLSRRSLTTWVAGSEAWVRGPRPGDRLSPLGGVGRRPVSRLLMEGQVPRSERPAFPVVGCGTDIVWLPGICRARSATPEPGQLAVRLDASLR